MNVLKVINVRQFRKDVKKEGYKIKRKKRITIVNSQESFVFFNWHRRRKVVHSRIPDALWLRRGEERISDGGHSSCEISQLVRGYH